MVRGVQEVAQLLQKAGHQVAQKTGVELGNRKITDPRCIQPIKKSKTMKTEYLGSQSLRLNICTGRSLDSARTANSEQFVGRVCLGRSGILLQVMIAKTLVVKFVMVVR